MPDAQTERGFEQPELLPGYVVVNSGTAIKKHNDSNDGGRDEHLCVDTQPGKIQANLFPEIFPVGKITS